MNSEVKKKFIELKKLVENENYMGWDPYDGLNSEFFQSLPFKNWKYAKWFWIQLFKLNPINLRKLFKVPKGHNSKGVGLFLYGYCQLFHLAENGNENFGTKKEILEKISFLVEILDKIKSKNYSGACWGYNFDWQNRAFFQPKDTPTVVATSFVADALFKAYEITNDEYILNLALSSCNFISQDLNRSYLDKEKFIFSYSPLDNSKVYNASLLGARLLSQGYYYSKNSDWLKLSKIAIQTICERQFENGSWVYGEAKNQQWIDSFHTGFNLECLFEYQKYSNDDSFENNFEKGLSFYLNNFFLENGTPKYYNNKIYPIDIHSPAQLIVTLIKTNRYSQNKLLIEKIIDFTFKNMYNSKGYFYYQVRPFFSSKIPYMRWANAWMFYALSCLFLSHNSID